MPLDHWWLSAKEACETSWGVRPCSFGSHTFSASSVSLINNIYFNQLTSFHLPLLFFTFPETYFYTLYLLLTPTWFPLSYHFTHKHTHCPCISGICMPSGHVGVILQSCFVTCSLHIGKSMLPDAITHVNKHNHTHFCIQLSSAPCMWKFALVNIQTDAG